MTVRARAASLRLTSSDVVLRAGLGLLLAAGGVCWSASAAAEEAQGPQGEAQADAQPEADESRVPWGGLMLDVGVPDGAQLSLVWRPAHWLRLHAGGGSNGPSLGVRGGLSLVAFDSWFTPSLVVEGGHFFEGDLQGFMAEVVGESDENIPEKVSYTYGNLHLGLELGTPDFVFFLRGGMSLIEADVTPAQSTGDGFRFEGKAHVSALSPSAKLGFTLYFL